MKKIRYAKSGDHPDDAISKTKNFINELQLVQEQYFNSLLNDLTIAEDLETWLFDYIYNENKDFNLTFTEYLESHGRSYK
jgi:hypothetical protein